MLAVNETHDPELRSWVESANLPGSDFPIQNLPFGVFHRALTPEPPRVGVAIGDRILDLRLCHRAGLFEGELALVGEACLSTSLNRLMALGQASWSALRRRVGELLREDRRRALQKKVEPCLVSMAEAVMLVPSEIGDYTDFYASIFHATNVGEHVPARQPAAAQLQVRADRLPRPGLVDRGQRHAGAAAARAGRSPSRRRSRSSAPSRRLDYELEVGFFVGPGNALGDANPDRRGRVASVRRVPGQRLVGARHPGVGISAAGSLSGQELRDVGLALGRDTRGARAVSRPGAHPRAGGDPEPLPYLDDARQRERGGLDLRLEASLASERMRAANIAPFVVSRSSLRHLYWTPASC